VVTAEVDEKLWYEHDRLTLLDVEEALDAPLDDPRWDIDEAHGGRVIAIGTCETYGRLFIALRPMDLEEGTWEVITAFPCEEEYWQRVMGDANE